MAPELPYRRVPAVQFAKRPADTRINPTVGGPTVEVKGKDKEKNYEVRAPVEEFGGDIAEQVADEIFRRLEIGLPLDKLFGLSPKLLKQARSILSKRRVPVHYIQALVQLECAIALLAENLPGDEVNEQVTITASYVNADAISAGDLPIAEVFITQQADGLLPAGAVVVGDPVLQYFNSLQPGEAPKQVFVAFTHVAGDSAALRVLYPLVNGVQEIESIVDGGSQIVSMAQSVAVKSGITWNPDINIYMQSANAQVEKSVGLAKNVAFRFGELTLYLQVHIIKSPAYEVLLGRPFEVLTGSMVQNGTDGSQLITLTDPGTQQRCAVPTFEKGTIRQLKKARGTSTEIPPDPTVGTESSNFQSSMI